MDEELLGAGREVAPTHHPTEPKKAEARTQK